MSDDFFVEETRSKSQRKAALERRKKERLHVDEFDDMEFVANRKDKKHKRKNLRHAKPWGGSDNESDFYDSFD